MAFSTTNLHRFPGSCSNASTLSVSLSKPGEQPVVQSRYSIVIAASRRARQLIAGEDPMVAGAAGKKPLSIAIDELYHQKVKILPEEETTEEEEQNA